MPIISVMGVGYNVSKFDVQLYLREMFLDVYKRQAGLVCEAGNGRICCKGRKDKGRGC